MKYLKLLPILGVLICCNLFAQTNNFPLNGSATLNDGHLIQTGTSNNLETQGALKLKNYLLFDSDGDFTGGNYYSIQDHASGDYLRMGYGFNSHFVLNNLGNVGIGTTSPLTKLHVATNEDALSWIMTLNNARNSSTVSNYGVGLQLKHSANSEGYKWGGIASVQEGQWANLSGLALYANEKEYMRIKNNGYVGIGTTNPTAKLELSTASYISSLLTLRDTHYSPNQVYHFQIESDGLKIRQDNTVNYQFKSGGNFIVNNGKLGVGITSPVHSLDINGSARIGDSDQSGLVISDYTTALSDVPGTTAGIQIKGPIHAHVVVDIQGNDQNDGFYVRVPETLQVNPIVNKTAFVVKASGAVGIGTTTPTEKLEVNGTIRSKEVKVEASPWPDYVFEPDYDLRSLEEIGKFIQTEKHLPEVPSSAEVQENGIALGEMNALLLKKIEELTLYTISQEAKIDKLNQAKGQEPIAKSLEKKIEELTLHMIQMGKENSKLRQQLKANASSQIEANSQQQEASSQILQRLEKLEKIAKDDE